MDAGEKTTAYQYAQKALGFLRQKDSIVLMFCIGLSFILWLLIQLSQDQVAYINIQLSYENVPSGQVVVNKLPTEANVKLRAHGWDLLFSLFRKRKVSVDMAKLGSRSLILTNYNINLFTRDLPPDFQVIHIEPDSISIDYDRLVERKVPIHFNSKLLFSPSFDQSEIAIVQPDSVIISGPKSLIDTIAEWPTQLVEAKDLSEDFSGIVELKELKHENMRISNKVVSFHINVEQFTESSLIVPIDVINAISDSTLRILPRQINVNFEVPLSKFEQVNASLFRAEADLAGTADTTDNLLDIKLVKYPPYLKNIRYQPPYTEFFYVRE